MGCPVVLTIRAQDVANAGFPEGDEGFPPPLAPPDPSATVTLEDGGTQSLGALIAQFQALIEAGIYANFDFMYLEDGRIIVAFEDRSVPPPPGATGTYSMVVVDEDLTILEDTTFPVDEIDPIAGIDLRLTENDELAVFVSFVSDAPPRLDTFAVEELTPDQIIGTRENDKIHADADDTIIHGYRGDDVLRGNTGDDELHGGRGDDELRGNYGDDHLDGDGGNDILRGGDGNDRLEGGRGDDLLMGQDGNDTMLGGHGNDHLIGCHGDDFLDGSKGDDLLDGGNDDDQLFGQHGDDILIGGNQDDMLHGGRGNDILDGGRHSDVLNGGRGDDILTGGKHDDIFQFDDRFGHDTITDFSQGEDRIAFEGFDGDLSSLTVVQEGDDVRIGWGKGSVLLEDTDVEEIDEEDFLI